jgi:hypothetical protein
MPGLRKWRSIAQNGSPMRWWWACRFTRMARATKTRCARAAFARQLHGRFRLPVFEVDERYSTTEALPPAPAMPMRPRPASFLNNF